MRNLWIMTLALFAIGAGITVYAQRAECAFCNSFPCYNSAGCGYGCVCLKRGGEITGQCYSVD